GKSTNHSVDLVSVPHCVLETLQEHDRHPAPEDRALCVGVKGAAMAIGRSHAPFLIAGAALLRKRDRGATRKSHVTLIRQEGLASLTDGNQRRRTSRLHREARPAQIQ